MKKKSELEGNLFDKAMEWYQSGDRGKREAALELFPEDMLKNEIDNYRKRNKVERLKLRDVELEKSLEDAKKMFPVGTIIWSDDGTDTCPNIIVGEPYIGNTKYGTHIPYEKYHYFEDKDVEKKTILVHAIRVSHGSIPGEEIFRNSVIGLEKIMLEMKKPEQNRYPAKDFFVDIDSYRNNEAKKKAEEIKNLNDIITRNQKEIDRCKAELAEWMEYNPYAFSVEMIDELVKKWKW